jgi:hypothetical protein
MSNDILLSVSELNDRIAILRDNMRQLVEQVAGSSGAQGSRLDVAVLLWRPCPTGKSLRLPVQPCLQKYFDSLLTQITSTSPIIPAQY